VNAALMANHGPVVVALTMDYMIKNAELIEKLALLYYGTSRRGKTYIRDNPADLDHFHPFFVEQNVTFYTIFNTIDLLLDSKAG
jgi:ribulose-5-phosphate 4-epimerase/fuculose-1-phosphate aldolase